jgi:hypothetical protein
MSQVILIQSVQVTANDFDEQFTRTAEQASTNHGIAPRIELDAEIYRDGPLSIGFYLALDFLVVLAGPLEQQIDVASCFGDGGGLTPCSRIDTPGTRDFQSSGILSYQLARDRLTYQGTAGLRFSWMGGP